MIFLVIGIFVVVAVGAFLRQQGKTSSPPQEELPEPEALDLPDEEDDGEILIRSAKPLTSPELASKSSLLSFMEITAISAQAKTAFKNIKQICNNNCPISGSSKINLLYLPLEMSMVRL